MIPFSVVYAGISSAYARGGITTARVSAVSYYTVLKVNGAHVDGISIYTIVV